ncbi:hypothetical protein [Pararhodobacter oceanensis]|nr:hypothetical protein [Pararhodobacter oceanensis]
MLQALIEFYNSFPDSLLSVFGKRRSEISPDLLDRLTQYRDVQIHNLSQAEIFQIDDEAEAMLAGLMNEMSSEALEDTFQHVKLPFPAMIIEKRTPVLDFMGIGLLTQIDAAIEAQFHAVHTGGLMPSLTIISTDSFPFKVTPTPTADLASVVSSITNLSGGMVQDRTNALTLLSMGVGIATLLKYKGMLEVEKGSAYPRAERRRAERAGRPLPDIRVSKISLGQAGRGQLAAMSRDRNHDPAVEGKRRAHWVRGHWMRTAAGGLSFRTPHIRGAGPVIHQERRVTE